MVGHHIFNQAIEEHINKTNPTMSQEEWDALGPGSDVWNFHCKACDKELSKRSAAFHFKKHHPDDFTEEEVKQWIVIKDANACKHGRLTKCILSKLYEKYAQRENEQPLLQDELGDAEVEQQIVEAEEQDVAMAAVHVEHVLGPKPKMKASSSKGDWQDAIQDINQKLDAILQPTSLEVALPEVIPRDIVFQWDHPKQKKLRTHCPIPKAAEAWDRFSFDDFGRYLKLNTDQNAQSRKFTILSMKRFFYLLDIQEGDFEAVGTICSIYQNDVFQQMQDAPMMDNDYAFARGINSALHNYCHHLMQVCNKHRWPEAKATLQQLVDECLSGTKKKDHKQKKLSSMYKKIRDAERLLNFPAAATIKEEVKQSMKRLYAIQKHAQDQELEELPDDLRLEALTEVVGIIFYNAFGGRIGEWRHMKKAHVQAQKAKGANHLLCRDHKTSATYGAVAKHIPGGSWEAFEIFMSLPGKKTDLFLEPYSVLSQTANVAGLLKRYGLLHFGGSDVPNSNLIRKMFHSALLKISREDGAMGVFEVIDAHSKKVARQVYTITNPEDDANLAHRVFQEVLGDHVEFPWDELETEEWDVDTIVEQGKAIDFGIQDVDIEVDDEVPEDIFLMLVPIEGVPPTHHESFWDNLASAIPGDEPQPLEDDVLEEMFDAEPLEDAAPQDLPDEAAAPLEDAIVEPQPKRARYMARPGEKAYLDTKAIKDADGNLIFPVKKDIQNILEEGQSNGSLTQYMTYEGVKSHLRKMVYLAQQGAPLQGAGDDN